MQLDGCAGIGRGAAGPKMLTAKIRAEWISDGPQVRQESAGFADKYL
jgi:hypothetical protein